VFHKERRKESDAGKIARPRCNVPKLTGAEIRSGPASSPQRSASFARASSASERMRRARTRNATPSSVSASLRVVRWTSCAPSERPTGKDVGRVFHDQYQSYGLLMDSFDSITANVVKKAS
jgi:hypothetical protein